MTLQVTFLRRFGFALTTGKGSRGVSVFSRSFLAPASHFVPQDMGKRKGKWHRQARTPRQRRCTDTVDSPEFISGSSTFGGSIMGWRRGYEVHMTPGLYARRPGVSADGIITGLGKEFVPPDKSKTLRPTHFLSLQVSQSEQVTESIKKIHQSMVAKYPGLQPALVDPASAHLTLMVMHLDTDNMHYRSPLIEDGVQFLEEAIPTLEAESLLGPLNLSLKGLSNFNDRVLYLDVEPGKDLDRVASMAKTLSEHFAVRGVPNSGESFVSHITVAKLSKIKRNRRNKRKKAKVVEEAANVKKAKVGLSEHLVENSGKGKKKSTRDETEKQERERRTQELEEAAGKMLKGIPKEAYQEFVDFEAGSCKIDEVHLCRMIRRLAGQYYHVEGRIRLDG
ncbi:hypothetical protein BSKO_03109 [Bryopsis sp. KO-2023]|nr:hypothetical protein BSKO_03109 [Bryopsis sp. KO-2023]